jgi:hypothetical protein
VYDLLETKISSQPVIALHHAMNAVILQTVD